MSKFLPVEEQLALIRRGTTEIIPETELKVKLEESLKTGNPLKIKLGCDPTRPDLHLGHSVILRKLRQFQDLGHHAILIIGDFTSLIGDPTGQNKTRPALTPEIIKKNGETYFKQASKILDTDRTEIVYNSDWLGKMNFADVIKLAGQMTVARMLERDDFSKRYSNNDMISLHEFLYPLAQGQDSVHLKSDVELGGTDQKFNLLVGRQLQKDNSISPQICLMMPLLVGTDGVQKMSKSYDNYIGLDDEPNNMYGKSLSIPDHLIYTYFELLTDVETSKLPKIKEKAENDPRNAKHDLAYVITAMYHGKEAADDARLHFEKTIINKGIPDVMDVFQFESGSSLSLVNVIKQIGFAPSNGEAKRLIQQGGVSLDGEQVKDVAFELSLKPGEEVILKVGKRKFARIRFKIN
ncbi:MAG: tyrosine--tRNA ligase [Bacteroidetes bacterium]|nr:tyrosine--tRNA ligase [Bacteroidota bacterium]